MPRQRVLRPAKVDRPGQPCEPLRWGHGTPAASGGAGAAGQWPRVLRPLLRTRLQSTRHVSAAHARTCVRLTATPRDPEAEVVVLGLTPGAHGANRTGRMFTGDKSGEFLYRALWETGFASQPDSEHRQDGLELRNLWITAAARCAPPDNKPLPEELRNCENYLREEIALLDRVQLVVALGSIGATAYLRLLSERGLIASRSAYTFGHGVLHRFDEACPLLCSYHPSQQNTSTGRLTRAMLREVFQRAAQFTTRNRFLEACEPASSS